MVFLQIFLPTSQLSIAIENFHAVCKLDLSSEALFGYEAAVRMFYSFVLAGLAKKMAGNQRNEIERIVQTIAANSRNILRSYLNRTAPTGSGNSQSTLDTFVKSEQGSSSNSSFRPNVPTTTTAGMVGSIGTELTRRFPTLASRRPAGSIPYRASNPFSANVTCRVRQSTSTSNQPKAKRQRQAYKHNKEEKPIFEDIILIPDPSVTEVPTHSKRLALEVKKLIVHQYPISKSWDGTMLIEQVRKCFPVLQANDSEREPLPFEFLKACYGQLIEINLQDGAELTGEILLRMSGQGAVYVRSLVQIEEKEVVVDIPDEGTVQDDVIAQALCDDDDEAFLSGLPFEVDPATDDKPKPVEIADITFHSALQKGKEKLGDLIVSDRPFILYVTRRNIWRNSLDSLKDVEVSELAGGLIVVFVGEEGVDDGGLTREFFSVLWQRSQDCPLSVGTIPYLTLRKNAVALDEQEYKIFGQLVAMALLNGANGPKFFSESFAKHLLDPSSDYFAIEDIPDETLKLKVQNVKESSTAEGLKEAISHLEDERVVIGYQKMLNPPLKDKELLVKAIARHAVTSADREIKSFLYGLQLGDVLSTLRKYPKEALEELTGVQKAVTAHELKRLFKTDLSEPG